jgi:hypothetical protein
MAYANVAIASPSPRPRLVLDERLIQEIVDTVQQSLDDYLHNGCQSVTPLTPLAPAEPLSTPLPPKELPSPCSPAIEPPADKSNSCSVDYSPVNEPPSVQPDVPVRSVQPRLPSSCRLLYVQTTPLLLSYAPDIYMVLFGSLVSSLGLASLVDFRDTG